jgi:hypothetical protein
MQNSLQSSKHAKGMPDVCLRSIRGNKLLRNIKISVIRDVIRSSSSKNGRSKCEQNCTKSESERGAELTSRARLAQISTKDHVQCRGGRQDTDHSTSSPPPTTPQRLKLNQKRQKYIPSRSERFALYLTLTIPLVLSSLHLFLSIIA